MKTIIVQTVGQLRAALSRVPDHRVLVCDVAVCVPSDSECDSASVDIHEPDGADFREAAQGS